MIVEMQNNPRILSLGKMRPGKMGIIRAAGKSFNHNVVGQVILRTADGYIILKRANVELSTPGYIRLDAIGKDVDEVMVEMLPPGFEIKLIQE